MNDKKNYGSMAKAWQPQQCLLNWFEALYSKETYQGKKNLIKKKK